MGWIWLGLGGSDAEYGGLVSDGVGFYGFSSGPLSHLASRRRVEEVVRLYFQIRCAVCLLLYVAEWWWLWSCLSRPRRLGGMRSTGYHRERFGGSLFLKSVSLLSALACVSAYGASS